MRVLALIFIVVVAVCLFGLLKGEQDTQPVWETYDQYIDRWRSWEANQPPVEHDPTFIPPTRPQQ
jgi:hypothetical protein